MIYNIQQCIDGIINKDNMKNIKTSEYLIVQHMFNKNRILRDFYEIKIGDGYFELVGVELGNRSHAMALKKTIDGWRFYDDHIIRGQFKTYFEAYDNLKGEK